MQRHFNVTFPLACPHCLMEMLATLDEVEERRTIHCSSCGTDVDLKAEDLALPAAIYTESEQAFFGIEF
jgi:transcription elongation factor Elf1